MRKDRTYTDASVIKLMTFEYARAKMSTIGEVSYDCKACFGRAERSTSNKYAQKQNVDANFLLARDIRVENIGRHVKTGLNVSIVTYKQENEDTRLGGANEGKADVLMLYTLGISILLHSHKAIAPSLCLQSRTRAWAIEHNNVAYLNEPDGHVSAEHNCEFPTEMVVEDMRQSPIVLNNLTMISVGSLT